MFSRPLLHWIVFFVLLTACFAANLLPMERPVSWWREDGYPGGGCLSEARGLPFCYEQEFYAGDEDEWVAAIMTDVVWKNVACCVGFSFAMMLLSSYWARRRFACSLGTTVVAQLALAAVLMLNLTGRPVLTMLEDDVLCRGYGWPFAVYYDDLPVVFDTMRRCLDDSEWWIQWGAAPMVLNAAAAVLIVGIVATLFDLMWSSAALRALFLQSSASCPRRGRSADQ